MSCAPEYLAPEILAKRGHQLGRACKQANFFTIFSNCSDNITSNFDIGFTKEPAVDSAGKNQN